LGLFFAAHKLGLAELKDVVLRDLELSLAVDSVSLVLTTVGQIEEPSIARPLIDACLAFVRKNIKGVIAAKSFDILPRNLVVEILKDSITHQKA